MTAVSLRLPVVALSFGLICALGFWLSHSGKPYPGVIFTLHKLIALGAVVLLALIVKGAQPPAGFSPLYLGLIVGVAACCLIAIITGGLMSMDHALPPLVHRLHQLIPYLMVLSTAGLLGLLLRAAELT